MKVIRGFFIAKCDPCDALICFDTGNPGPPICPGCGAASSIPSQIGTVLKGKISRPDESKAKARLADVRIAYAPQHSRGGAIARHERTIDRQGNRYSEKVTMCETGEVVHFDEDSLRQHRGHGSDRKDNPKP